MLVQFAYIKPESLNEAAGHLSRAGAVVLAGGTDPLTRMREHIFEVRKVVSISGLAEPPSYSTDRYPLPSRFVRSFAFYGKAATV
ncbi:FAD binding domain-containing protein [Desulfosarcina sp.]|uniref:FAD binding domain-containing protein n=1 Tax=Desulfosarcina sp. TaxID=2027861 RepID=UPI003970AE24